MESIHESTDQQLLNVSLDDRSPLDESAVNAGAELPAQFPSRPASVASLSSSIAVDFDAQLTFDSFAAGTTIQESNVSCGVFQEEDDRPTSVLSTHSTYDQFTQQEVPSVDTSYVQSNGYTESHNQQLQEQDIHNSTFQHNQAEQSYEPVRTPVPQFTSRPPSSCSHSSIAGDFVSQLPLSSPVNHHYFDHQQPQNYTSYGPQMNANHYNSYFEPPINPNYQQPYHSQSYGQSYYPQNSYYGSGYYNRGVPGPPNFQQFNNSYQYPKVSRNFESNFHNRSFDPSSHRNFDMNSSIGSESMHAAIPGYPQTAPDVYSDWMAKYTQWWYEMYYRRNQKRGERQRLTPLVFPSPHSRVSFGSQNLLILVSGQSVILQQLDCSLIDVGSDISITTWPGPLVKNETDKNDILEYIRTQETIERPIIAGQEIEMYYYNHQKKQIWQLLLMLVRQNGTVSGADLAELLITNNEVEFETGDQGTDVAKFRRFLMFGQRKTALDFATKKELWGHAFALSYLMNPREMQPSAMPSNYINLMLKFVNSNVGHEDPLYILYRCLIQKMQDYYSNSDSKTVPITNLPQFAILLANECDVTLKTISGNNLSTDLLKAIVAIRNNESQYFIKNSSLDATNHNQPLFSEELVFINEIFEFGRNWQEIVYELIPFKLMLALKFFDFGLLHQTQKYCQFIRNAFSCYKQCFGENSVCPNVNWNLVMKLVNNLESRLNGYDVGNEGEDETIFCDVKESQENNVECSQDSEDVKVGAVADTVKTDTTVSKVVNLPTVQNVVSPSFNDPESLVINEQKVSEVVVKKPTSTWRQRQSSLPERNVTDQSDAALKPLEETSKKTIIQQQQPSQQLNFFIPPEPSTAEPLPEFVSKNAPEVSNTAVDETDDYYNQALKPANTNNFNSTVRTDFSNQGPPMFSTTLSPIPSHHQEEPKTSKPVEYAKSVPNEGFKQKATENEKPQEPKAKGFLDSIFAKFVPPGPKRAILPDDKNPSIIWDEKTKRWVDINAGPQDEISNGVMNGPPKIPLQNQPQMYATPQKLVTPQIPNSFSASQFQFTKSKQKRYVDILQQQKAS